MPEQGKENDKSFKITKPKCFKPSTSYNLKLKFLLSTQSKHLQVSQDHRNNKIRNVVTTGFLNIEYIKAENTSDVADYNVYLLCNT